MLQKKTQPQFVPDYQKGDDLTDCLTAPWLSPKPPLEKPVEDQEPIRPECDFG